MDAKETSLWSDLNVAARASSPLAVWATFASNVCVLAALLGLSVANRQRDKQSGGQVPLPVVLMLPKDAVLPVVVRGGSVDVHGGTVRVEGTVDLGEPVSLKEPIDISLSEPIAVSGEVSVSGPVRVTGRVNADIVGTVPVEIEGTPDVAVVEWATGKPLPVEIER